MSINSIQNLNQNPFHSVGSVKGVTAQPVGGEIVATTQANAGQNSDSKVASLTGRENYACSSINGGTGYGLAFGAESTGLQGSGAGEDRSINLVA